MYRILVKPVMNRSLYLYYTNEDGTIFESDNLEDVRAVVLTLIEEKYSLDGIQVVQQMTVVLDAELKVSEKVDDGVVDEDVSIPDETPDTDIPDDDVVDDDITEETPEDLTEDEIKSILESELGITIN